MRVTRELSLRSVRRHGVFVSDAPGTAYRARRQNTQHGVIGRTAPGIKTFHLVWKIENETRWGPVIYAMLARRFVHRAHPWCSVFEKGEWPHVAPNYSVCVCCRSAQGCPLRSAVWKKFSLNYSFRHSPRIVRRRRVYDTNYENKFMTACALQFPLRVGAPRKANP